MGQVATQQKVAERFAAEIPKLDNAAETCAALTVTKTTGAFAEVFALAGATTELRTLLTDELVGAAIMPLQGTKIGFNTDRVNAREGPKEYPVAVVRDVCIWAMMNGARMIGNEVNIIGGNGYLTKEHFMRVLDDMPDLQYRFNHALPRISPAGAIVKTVVTWSIGSEAEQAETIERAIKGNQYSGADQYLGKMDRKASAWLLSVLTGRRYSDGDADEIRNRNAIDVQSTSPLEAPIETVAAPATVVTVVNPDIETPITSTEPFETLPADALSVRDQANDIIDDIGVTAIDFLRSINWIGDTVGPEALTEAHCAKIVNEEKEFRGQALPAGGEG